MRDLTPNSAAVQKVLRLAAPAWYTPVLIGQFAFAAYIVYSYGLPLIIGDLNGWNSHLSQAYVPGREMGNAAVFAHLVIGLIVHVGGPLQLVPAIRKRFPAFHRWTGRAFVLGMIIAVGSGSVMLVAREIGDWTLRAGFMVQGTLILWFSFFAVRHAMRREIAEHMKWATRLFLAASAVWFFRVLIMVWFVTTGGIGIDTSNGTGWFIDLMSALQFLPLVLYEVYWRVRDRGGMTSRVMMSVFLGISTLLLSVGVFLATFGMWFPILG